MTWSHDEIEKWKASGKPCTPEYLKAVALLRGPNLGSIIMESLYAAAAEIEHLQMEIRIYEKALKSARERAEQITPIADELQQPTSSETADVG